MQNTNPYLLHSEKNQSNQHTQNQIFQPHTLSQNNYSIPEQDRIPAKKTHSENNSDRYVPPYSPPISPQYRQQQGFNPQPNYPPPNYPQTNHQHNQQRYIPPQNYPQQGYAPNHHQQIIVPQPGLVNQPGVAMSCPLCGHSGQHIVQKVNGTSVWIWVVVLCLFTGCCCCLPLCCDCCKDTKYLCAKCGYAIRTDKDC